MKKNELLALFEALPFVDTLVGLTNTDLAVPKGASIKLYNQAFIECEGSVATGRNISLYVIDEGTANERAYYKDKEPAAANAKHPLEISLAAQIAAKSGKVVSSGEGFIIVDGFEEVAGEMEKRTWYVSETDGKPQIKVVK